MNEHVDVPTLSLFQHQAQHQGSILAEEASVGPRTQ